MSSSLIRRLFGPAGLALAVLLMPAMPASAAEEAEAPAAEPADAPAAAPVSKAGVHKTKVPRSFIAHYQMQRGGIRGAGQLVWSRRADGYDAQLRGTVAGLALLDWRSSGGIDATGLAPVRYVERRLTKSDREVNFRKAESRIAFSGKHDADIAYVPGAQDRLSWLIQLPAIVAADGARLSRSGQTVTLFVVGTSGHAGDWVFESAGRENITTPEGNVQSQRWTHRAPTADDTEADVWLDPSRNYLPVRVRLRIPPAESPVELNLVDASF